MKVMVAISSLLKIVRKVGICMPDDTIESRTNAMRGSRVPAYLELANELEAKIRSGDLPHPG